ncbi:phosphoribosylformylglycinamidine synthase [Sporomusa aerivorans]|uniref:phosphoribosylformylglycinamidine synthase n=1 Tax=Sporomusa aerivorans TaxID=204936 RepID=UPI00352B04FF
MSAVRRIFVEKKPGFAVEAEGVFSDLKHHLGITGLTGLRILHRYDVSGISDAELNDSLHTIFSEPPVDVVYLEHFPLPAEAKVFAMEYLPGQYDQRADWAAQSVQILTQKEQPVIRTAKVLVLEGELSEADLDKAREYCINPVEAREAQMAKPETLALPAEMPPDVAVLPGFISMNQEELAGFLAERGLAMGLEDLAFCQVYFRDTEKRDPTLTEIKVIDTYWSDHCRHTTFHTKIEQVAIEDSRFTRPVATAWQAYQASRQFVYGDKAGSRDVSLMDIATAAMKKLKKQGRLKDLDESEEINACSIVVQAEVDGRAEEWLVMFKNETHNHPTEIEPFGGAATCLGGCIRDPLSGRAYVYQAMRVTGSGDPRAPLAATLPGKLPQRKITTSAAAGYSSYGNQIGLATGQVAEIYDEGYIAKRMEIGAVMAAAPRQNVIRAVPAAGDVVILVGGRTGRDGCGGATGSSKAHTEESLESCGAEVQKGNPPTERKIQRLFRKREVSTMIKRCNDFGAGGVSVAIGELTDGLTINLDAIPKKYEGLDGTELAISESQERMAVVVAAANARDFIRYADEENLEATVVAEVTADERLTMLWRSKAIVSISREFLNTNGVKQRTDVAVAVPAGESYFAGSKVAGGPQDIKDAWLHMLQNLNIGSQKGLVERFDSSIGAGTVLMPFGGKYQDTPAEGMVAKLPVLAGNTTTGTIMTYGFNPGLSSWSPFHGAVYAIVEAVAKVVALGGNFRTVRLTLQEYFEKLGQDSGKWGKPFSALLGAFYAQQQLGIPAIGGKDSMSGTFNDITVPPTLVAFAVTSADVSKVVSQEFKQAGSQVVLLSLPRGEDELPDFAAAGKLYDCVYRLVQDGKVLAAHTVKLGGIAEAVTKMAFGNRIGIEMAAEVKDTALFAPDYGSLILEVAAEFELEQALAGLHYKCIGRTTAQPVIGVNGQHIALTEALAAWRQPLEEVFPARPNLIDNEPASFAYYTKRNGSRPAVSTVKPRVLIPVFPGTNCEYDSYKAFAEAGASPEILVIRNLTPVHIEESMAALAAKIAAAQIVMLPGGFSAGDEPDGSGKFIATVFRNPRVKEAVTDLLERRDGLMLGICNGFQALIKLGLVPYGEIRDLTDTSPTLTFNKIGRHISSMVNTKVISTLSPWLSNVEVGEVFAIPASHGEGRFYATAAEIERLAANGQIATQYVDFTGRPTYDIAFNPNGSFQAIEAITSPDGRVLGKMGHSERIGDNVARNIPGGKDQRLFLAGVNYFK